MYRGFSSFQAVLTPPIKGVVDMGSESQKNRKYDEYLLVKDHHDRAASMREEMRKKM